jgi:hypothetical protein
MSSCSRNTANKGKKKKMDNYKEIESKLASKTPFSGNSLTAYLEEDGEYRVYSYRTLIATSKGVDWLDCRKYSQTTSRHQDIIRKAWGLN